MDVLKAAGSSKLFLAAVIIFSVSLLLNIVSSFSVFSAIDLSGLVGGEPYFDMRAIGEVFNRLVGVLRIYAWFSWIPTAAICAGLWMFYSACKNSLEPSVKTSGLTVIKVSTLCSIALSVVVVVGFFVMLVGPLMEAITDPYTKSAVSATVITTLIVAFGIAAVPMAFYYVLTIKTIHTVRHTATTGQPSDRVSTFVAVWNFILAGLQLFSLLSAAADISLLNSFCSIAFQIMMGIAILQYKSSMRGLMYETRYDYPQQ